MANRVLAPEPSVPRPAPSMPAAVVWLRGLVEREALPIMIVSLWLSLLILELPKLLGPDSWFSLIGGRYIADHGLPHVDSLTYWTVGTRWINQQWGAQLVLYEATNLGGVRAAALLGVGCVGAALVLGVVAARRFGASARSAALCAALPLLATPWFAQVRAQSLALPFFVAVYALLVADSREPSRRVLLVFALLVVWANLHGSVALGAGLVALYGLTLLRRAGTRRRGLLLAVGAPLTLLVSPYGLDLVGYYRLMLLRPPLAKYVTEWQPPNVAPITLVFFVTVIGGAALWGAHRRRLTSFERWAIVVLLLAAMGAIRNGVWFEFAAVVTAPRLLDGAWPSRIVLTRGVRAINVVVAVAAVAGIVAALVAQTSRPPLESDSNHSPASAAVVAAAAGNHGMVYPDDLDADWLLWEQPSLAGRIAYDVRFELMNARQLRQLKLLDEWSRPVWRRCGSRARVVTFPRPAFLKAARREGVLTSGARVILDTPTFVVVEQPSTGSFCKL